MPSSVPVSPLLMPAPRNVADWPASRMSAPKHRHMPPPWAGPLIAAMIGWGMLRMVGMRSAMVCMARMAMRDIGSPSTPGGTPWSSRSRPAQKPRPAPVRTTTQVSLSAATSRSAS